jgi:hypothetical protein
LDVIVSIIAEEYFVAAKQNQEVFVESASGNLRHLAMTRETRFATTGHKKITLPVNSKRTMTHIAKFTPLRH